MCELGRRLGIYPPPWSAGPRSSLLASRFSSSQDGQARQQASRNAWTCGMKRNTLSSYYSTTHLVHDGIFSTQNSAVMYLRITHQGGGPRFYPAALSLQSISRHRYTLTYHTNVFHLTLSARPFSVFMPCTTILPSRSFHSIHPTTPP